MLIYEFKERHQNSGEKIHSDEHGNEVVEYKTGYKEFKVRHIRGCEKGVTQVFSNSLSIAVVMKGNSNAKFTLNGQSHDLKLEDRTAYFIMPGQEVTFSANDGSEKASIFVCSCDI